MSVYRIKTPPERVNAVQWIADDSRTGDRFLGWLDANDIRLSMPDSYRLHLPRGGWLRYTPGQWLVRLGLSGDFVVMDDDEFTAKYEPVDE